MTPEDHPALVADYQAGMPIRELQEKYRCHHPQIYRALWVAGVTARRYPPRAATRLEDVEWLTESGLSLTQVCDRMRVSKDTLWSFCWRRDRLDLYWRLADREPDAEQRRAVRDGIRRARKAAS